MRGQKVDLIESFLIKQTFERTRLTDQRRWWIQPLEHLGVHKVVAELGNQERLKRSRLHPVALLVALKTYAAGQAVRGNNQWNPVPKIMDALDGAFYTAFDNVEPSGKRWLLALDVSGSMAGSVIAGVANLTAREGSAAMALVTAATEAEHHIVGFTGRGYQVNRAQPCTVGA
jgi:60 kDa SS-A/Ro ribonucleoprotein